MYTLNCGGRLLMLDKPVIMGIINCTPDSFYAGSRAMEMSSIVLQAGKMINDGAAILDVGGQSTRPGSERISDTDEMERVIPAIQSIHAKFPGAIISIDTFYSTVARSAIDAGASIINDISSGSIDPAMIATVAELGVPYVLMHMKGSPQNMQDSPEYKNVVSEVLDFFTERIDGLQNKGIKDILVDPGFGFGKTIDHNFELLRSLSVFQVLERPILVGISRKSTIYRTLGVGVEDALNGTTVLNTVALMNGASILRVHDVKEAAEAVRLVNHIQQ